MRKGQNLIGERKPPINFIEDLWPPRGAVNDFEVHFNPRNKVVFKCSLDGLVEEVRSEKFVYIGSWEVGRKRLG
jgi:hypothetical protein